MSAGRNSGDPCPRRFDWPDATVLYDVVAELKAESDETGALTAAEIVDRVLCVNNLSRFAQPVELDLEFNGVHPDPWGGTRAGFSATTEISRKAYGVDFEIPMDGGGVVVGDASKIFLEVEAVLAQD